MTSAPRARASTRRTRRSGACHGFCSLSRFVSLSREIPARTRSCARFRSIFYNSLNAKTRTSGLRVDDHVGDVGRSRRIRSSISLARECASSSRLVPSSAERQERDQAVVRAQEAQLARRLPGLLLTTRAHDRRALGLDLARLALLRRAAPDASAHRRSRAPPRRSPLRAPRRSSCASSSVRSPGSFTCSESSVWPSTWTRDEVVHLAHAPHPTAASCTRSRRSAPSSGSTWTTTSAFGSARSTAASTASAAACPWPTAAPGETAITTSAN